LFRSLAILWSPSQGPTMGASITVSSGFVCGSLEVTLCLLWLCYFAFKTVLVVVVRGMPICF
jgi:hypothetical protein